MNGPILTAMVTPFDASGAVDWDATAHLMRHLIDNGSDGLVLSGTTGETSTLTDDEKVELFRLGVAEVGDRATIIAGTGSNDTAHSVHLTEKAAAIGVDGVLAVTPYYNKPPREGIIGHFTAIAAIGVPVILYNIPGRCVVNMPPDLIAELAQTPEIQALKEANEDVAQIASVCDIDGLKIFAGNDDLLLETTKCGGVGVISVASHLVGPQMGEVVAAVKAGDTDRAEAIDAQLRDLYAALFVTANPILTKAALHMLGVIPSAALRLPLVEATPVQRDILATVLEHQGILTRQ